MVLVVLSCSNVKNLKLFGSIFLIRSEISSIEASSKLFPFWKDPRMSYKAFRHFVMGLVRTTQYRKFFGLCNSFMPIRTV